MASDGLTAPEAIIFDMDGTLFQTETLLTHVHEQLFCTLREEGLYTNGTPPVERMLGCLGMVLDDIWRIVMPDGSEAAHLRAGELMETYELQGLAESRGTLYPHVEETLRSLHSRGIRLFVASNGQEPYVRAVAEHRGIAPLFDGIYSAGQYRTATKVELVRRLLDDHGIDSAWMVGDRSSDVEAGRANGLAVVGCAYAGFGTDRELQGCDALIADFRELLALLPGDRAASG